MRTLIETPVELSVSARVAATAWLNAFLATSQDEDRPILYRTLSLEFFDTGVQIICTDGTALFRTWAPSEEGAGWPLPEKVPEASVVVMDPDGFGIGFMRALLRVANEDGHEFEQLHFSTSAIDDGATIALGEEFMAKRLTLRACGQRIDLRLSDATFPGWRHLRLGIDDVERVEGMTVAPRLLAMIGKLKGVDKVDLAFHGENQRIAFVARGDAVVHGLLMPMRRIPAAS